MLGTGNALGQTALYSGRRQSFAFDPFSSQLYAAAAFRRMLSSYAGPLLRARRSSDNAETDIGATFSGALDTASLLAFAGPGGSAYLVKLYDQTGLNHGTVNVTQANQPRIVNAGVLETSGGVPVASVSGTQFMTVENSAGFARNAGNVTVAMLASVTNGGSNPYVFMASTPGGGDRFRLSASGVPQISIAARRLDAVAASVMSAALPAGLRRLIARARWSEALADIAVDGVTTVSGPFLTAGVTSDTDSSGPASVFAAVNGTLRAAGLFGGLVMSRQALPVAALDAALAKLG